jgi:hypothetical protein
VLAMIKILLLVLLISAGVQANGVLQPQDDGLLPMERSKLQSENKIDSRIKIYTLAASRCHKTFDSAVSANNVESVISALQVWMNLLNESFKDIDANVGRKKKSGALINFEITLRKSIKEVKDYRVNAPPEHRGYLDSWVTEAEQIQAKCLNILFLGK